MDNPAQRGRMSLARWLGGAAVALAMAGYYFLYFLPPRLAGSVDPDRYYHLGLSGLISHHGLLRQLPQVEDLGWGRYFPDKEFLFHVLTGAADYLGGITGVLLMVPLLGVAIALCLYAEASRVARPVWAAALAIAVPLLTAAFLFRITLLRPHELAILFFCLLVSAVLAKRAWLVAVAAAGFALSYHAFYLVVMVAGLAWLFRRQMGEGAGKLWIWSLAGLLLGIVLNPYFPSNLVMSLFHLKLALGVDLPPGSDAGIELAPLNFRSYWLLYGIVPASLLAAGVAVWVRRGVRPEAGGFWFIYTLTLALAVLGAKSGRAMEYAVPCSLLLIAHTSVAIGRPAWIPLNLAVLAMFQASTAWTFYVQNWRQPEHGSSALYGAALYALPPSSTGKKVFNCEWEAGAFVLFFRPDLRFVDLLDPAFLWRASPGKYIIRQRLIHGRFSAPEGPLKKVFGADYVVCAAPALNRQMERDPAHFQPVFGDDGDPLRAFSVRGD